MNHRHTDTHLDGSWSHGKEFVPGSFGVAIHVDQDVDSILMDAISCFTIAWDLKEETRERDK